MDLGTLCGEVATLDPGRVTGISLDRRGEIGERFLRCTTSRQWERDVFTSLAVAQESNRIDGGADDGPQEEVHLKVPHPKIR